MNNLQVITCPECSKKIKPKSEPIDPNVSIFCDNCMIFFKRKPSSSSSQKSHNSSETTTREKLNESILKEIECPICFEYMTSPIYQCPNGHTVCRTCQAQLTNCPTCRAAITNSRNRALERLAENILYPCSNEGCSGSYKHEEAEEHETYCEFALYKCPLDDCHRKNRYGEILAHVKDKHCWNYLENYEPVPVYFANMEPRVYVIELDAVVFVVKHRVVASNFCLNVICNKLRTISNTFDFVFDLLVPESSHQIIIRAKCVEEDTKADASRVQLPLSYLKSFGDGTKFTYIISIVNNSSL